MGAPGQEWWDVQLDVEVWKGREKQGVRFRSAKFRSDAVFLERPGSVSEMKFSDGDEVRLGFFLPPGNEARTASGRVVRVADRPSQPGAAPSVFMGVKFTQAPPELIADILRLANAPETVPSASRGAEESDVQFTHLPTEEYGALAVRLLKMSSADLAGLSDFERTAREILLAYPVQEREALLAGSSEDLRYRMLLLSLQMAAEMAMLKKVSRATAGTLSTTVENVIAGFQSSVAILDRDLNAMSGKLLSSPEDVEKFKGLVRKQGVLDQQLGELRLLHFSQVLRDTQEGSHPRPLEELCAIQPRSLESYMDMLGGGGRHPARRRQRRPRILDECIKLHSAWKEDLTRARASADQLETLCQGLALAGKAAVEAKGVKLLLEGADKSIFLDHMTRLRQQDRLLHGKFSERYGKAFAAASEAVRKRLAQAKEKADQAMAALESAVPEAGPKAGYRAYEPVSYQAARKPPKEETPAPVRTSWGERLGRVPWGVLGGVLVILSLYFTWNYVVSRRQAVEVSPYAEIMPLEEAFRQHDRFVGIMDAAKWAALSAQDKNDRARQLADRLAREKYRGLEIRDQSGGKIFTSADEMYSKELIFWRK